VVWCPHQDAVQTTAPLRHGRPPRLTGVELADVTEGEGPQKRTQRRRRASAGEDPAHPPVPVQGHVIDAVRAGDHPLHQRDWRAPNRTGGPDTDRDSRWGALRPKGRNIEEFRGTARTLESRSIIDFLAYSMVKEPWSVGFKSPRTPRKTARHPRRKDSSEFRLSATAPFWCINPERSPDSAA
jgi:hypothetical protein